MTAADIERRVGGPLGEDGLADLRRLPARAGTMFDPAGINPRGPANHAVRQPLR